MDNAKFNFKTIQNGKCISSEHAHSFDAVLTQLTNFKLKQYIGLRFRLIILWPWWHDSNILFIIINFSVAPGIAPGAPAPKRRKLNLTN